MKKKYTRIGALIVAFVFVIQGMGNTAFVSAWERSSKVSTDSQIQMSSEPEVVYVNDYSDAEERSQNFDSNWKFYLGEAGNAQEPAFDDSKWRQLSLPHDYSIEQEYSRSMEAESGYLPGGTGWYRKSFTVGKELEGKELRIDFGGVYMNATVWVNGQQLGTHPYGYTPFSFSITDYINYGQENIIAVRVDHKTPSSRWYSGSGIYRSVYFTVMDAVHVDLYGTQITTEDLESQQGGNVDMSIITKISNTSGEAKTVSLTHTVFKQNADVSQNIGSITTAEQKLEAGTAAEIPAVLQAADPELWSVENPVLYTVRTEVKAGDQIVDTYDTEYGFRYFDFDNNTGFTLNGEKVKLKGVCMHHDQGSLGSAANRRAIERQVEILKEMGCNSIRVTHNPAADELIEICNEKGILVIDEAFDTWFMPKNGNSQDYSKWFETAIEEGNQIIGAEEDMIWAQFDLNAMLKRGYNAPSIIMWSLGNEIMEGISGGYNKYPETAKTLIKWTQEIDTTRPVTTGENKLKAYWGEAEAIGGSLHEAGGTIGFNYCNGAQLDDWHSKKPNWKMYGAETASAINSRGIYYRTSGGGQTADKQLTSYDNSAVGWGAAASDAWYTVIQRDFVAGEYVWTGFDYIGEPTPWNGVGSGAVGSWESPKSSYFGIVDTAGFPKDTYYFYQSQWNEDVNTLHILPAWNENVVAKDASGNVPVVVYSDAASVELFFTSAASSEKVSLGKKTFTEKTTSAGYTYQIYEGEGASSTAHKNLYLTWDVKYEDGTIEAVAYDRKGNKIENTQGRSYVTTTAESTRLSAAADRTEITADGKDLSYITVDVTDAQGNIVPDAANRVKFEVEGDGILVGVDNGSSPDHDSYKASDRRAFSGKVLAIVQSTKNAGSIKVTATSEGLEPASVNIVTKSDSSGSGSDKKIDSLFMSKTYYVKTNNMPQLPTEIEARYTDGSSEKVAVTWNEISAERIQRAGNFSVQGYTKDGLLVSVNISMIDDIGGLLNYSTATPAGVKPILPDVRPAVMQDGTILTASFEVDWQEPDEDVYNEEGIVEIKGKADVLGQSVNVTATVRVQKEQVTIGNSISGNVMNLTQNIPPELQSDTLESIIDGSTVISDNIGGGANPTAWSNWKSSQNGENKAEITFEYATQQRIGQIAIHFAKDSGSMRYPDAGTTEIFISQDGVGWTQIDTTESIGNESERVKPYTYDFAPVTATFIKFCLTNADVQLGTQKPCTAITEIELKAATGDFVTNSTAQLAKLIVNGVELPASVLQKGTYSTQALFADVEAVSADNAAVTVLPAYEDRIRIIVESEDHSTQNVFVIQLNTEAAEVPDDASRDYPVEKLTAFADSAYPGTSNEGPARYVLDGNESTHWHTNWNNTEAQSVEKRWIGVELEEPAVLDALRYYPRVYGGINGAVTEYKVQYRLTEEEEWKDISAGTWNKDETVWKLAVFDEPVEAKYVRLVGVHTYADSGNDAHMSAAEIRVRMAIETIDISDPDNGITVEAADKVEVDEVDEEHPAEIEITVRKGQEELRYGIDYLIEYRDNTSAGTAAVTVRGIGLYSGSVTRSYEIVKQGTSDAITLKDLEELYETAMSYNEDEYGGDYWARFVILRDNAKDLIDNQETDPGTISHAYHMLNLSLNLLTKKPGNDADMAILKIILDEAQEAIDSKEVDRAIKDVQISFYKAYETANEVYAKGSQAEPQEIQEAANELLKQLHRLGIIKGNKEYLQELYDLLSELELNDYKDGDTKNYFIEVYNKADELLQDDNAVDTELEDIYKELYRAALALEPNDDTVDKTVLKQAIDIAAMCEENIHKYVEKGQAEFFDALREAREVYQDTGADSQQVEAAYEKLVAATARLRYKADKSLLEENYNKVLQAAAELDFSEYTEESVQMFNSLLEDARIMLADETLSEDDQQDIDYMVIQLNSAEELLKKKDTDSTDDTEADSEESDEHTDKETDEETNKETDNESDGETNGQSDSLGSGGKHDETNDGKSGASGKDKVKTGDMNSVMSFVLLSALAVTILSLYVKKRSR